MLKSIDNGSNAYDFFLIISLEKAEKMLTDFLRFPNEIVFSQLRPYARTYVEQFAHLLYSHHRSDTDRENLLQHANVELKTVLDEKQFVLFCEWGNQFAVFKDLEKIISLIGSVILFPLTRTNALLPPLTTQGAELLISTLLAYREKVTTVLNAIDEAEKSPRTEWEARAIELYNGGLEYSPDPAQWTTPYDNILVLFDLIEMPHCIRKLKATLSVEDFDSLNQYVTQKAQEMPTFPNMDLNELLFLINSEIHL